MKVNIRTVLSKYNSSIDSISSLYKSLSKFSITEWSLVVAFHSSYKGNFDNYSPISSDLEALDIYIEKIKQTSEFSIYSDGLKKRVSGLVTFNNTSEFVQSNTGCTATAYNISINVYGNVMVCEMLYNKNVFQLDSVNQHTIKEVWNSKIITDFYDFKIEHLKKTKDSPCHECEDLKKCKIGNIKKVCLVDVVKSYGIEKWDYPDPRCPRAPECNMDLLMIV